MYVNVLRIHETATTATKPTHHDHATITITGIGSLSLWPFWTDRNHAFALAPPNTSRLSVRVLSWRRLHELPRTEFEFEFEFGSACEFGSAFGCTRVHTGVRRTSRSCVVVVVEFKLFVAHAHSSLQQPTLRPPRRYSFDRACVRAGDSAPAPLAGRDVAAERLAAGFIGVG